MRRKAEESAEQAENLLPDAGIVVGFDDDICGFLYRGNRVLHRTAPARRPEHVCVVQPVSEGDALRSIQAELLAQRAQGVSLPGASAVDLNVVAQGRGGDQLRKQLRHQLQLPRALVHVLRPEEHLELLQPGGAGS